MQTKKCFRCGLEKDINLFCVKSSAPDGHTSECKECHNNYGKTAYRKDLEKSRERARINAKRSYRKNPERAKKYSIEYNKTHKEEKAAYNKRYKQDHKVYKEKPPKKTKEEYAQYKKDYYLRHKEEVRAYKHQYYLNHIEQEKKRTSEYAKNNPEAVKINKQKYMQDNPQARIAKSLRTIASRKLKQKSNGGRLISLLGCSSDFFWEYIASFWTEGMNRDNYGRGKGKWSIDHTIPLDMFDLTNEEEQKKAFHYTNSRPMWFPENASKCNSYDGYIGRRKRRKK